MDYTMINPTEAVDSLMADKAAEQLWQAFAYQLDADSLQWCADIAAITGSGDKGAEAVDHATAAAAQQTESLAAAAKFAAKIGSHAVMDGIDHAVDTRKTEWIPQYITQVETEHAQHATLAALAAADGDGVQADVHRVAMLRCEAAQQTALAAQPAP